jgi:hypothetical protein
MNGLEIAGIAAAVVLAGSVWVLLYAMGAAANPTGDRNRRR